jgi:ankyrin repeat protein
LTYFGIGRQFFIILTVLGLFVLLPLASQAETSSCDLCGEEVIHGNIAAVQRLLDKHADVNAHYAGLTPLEFALQNGQTATATLLVRHGAQVDGRFPRNGYRWSGWDDILVATILGDPTLVYEMISHGAPDRNFHSYLGHFELPGLLETEIAKSNIDWDASLNTLGPGGSSSTRYCQPSMLAAMIAAYRARGQQDVVHIVPLFDALFSAPSRQQAEPNDTLISSAVACARLVLALAPHPIDLDAIPKGYQAKAVRYAWRLAALGDTQPFLDFTAYGFDIDTLRLTKNFDANRDDQNELPYVAAMKATNLPLFEYFFNHGFSLDQENDKGNTALTLAVGHNSDEVNKLLALGANPAHFASDRSTERSAIWQALKSNNLPVFQSLIDHGGAGLFFDLYWRGASEFSQYFDLAQSTEIKHRLRSLLLAHLQLSRIVLTAVKDAHLSASDYRQALAASRFLGPDPTTETVLTLLTSFLDAPPPIPYEAIARTTAAQADLAGETLTRAKLLHAIANVEQAVVLAPWVLPFHETLCQLFQATGALERAYGECGVSLFASRDKNLAQERLQTLSRRLSESSFAVSDPKHKANFRFPIPDFNRPFYFYSSVENELFQSAWSSIAWDRDGSLWTVEFHVSQPDALLHVFPDGAERKFSLSKGNEHISSITISQSGDLWFTRGHSLGWVDANEHLHELTPIPSTGKSDIGRTTPAFTKIDTFDEVISCGGKYDLYVLAKHQNASRIFVLLDTTRSSTSVKLRLIEDDSSLHFDFLSCRLNRNPAFITWDFPLIVLDQGYTDYIDYSIINMFENTDVRDYPFFALETKKQDIWLLTHDKNHNDRVMGAYSPYTSQSVRRVLGENRFDALSTIEDLEFQKLSARPTAWLLLYLAKNIGSGQDQDFAVSIQKLQ